MTRQGRILGAATLVALNAACVTGFHPRTPLDHQDPVETPTGRFVLQYGPDQTSAEQEIKTAIRGAAPVLARWGHLSEPVTVWVLPSHDELEQATHRAGYDWLRAWARFDEVFVQSPQTWTVLGAAQRDVDELLLHELTHCLMYQQAAAKSDWTKRQIPLWFREGMASYTAGQAYRWPGLEDLAQYMEEHPTADPVSSPDGLYQDQSSIVYSAAHHAFAFLVSRYGEDAVRRVLHAMSAGASFDAAFEQGVGLASSDFERDFKRYVRWRAFRQPRRAQSRR